MCLIESHALCPLNIYTHSRYFHNNYTKVRKTRLGKHYPDVLTNS